MRECWADSITMEPFKEVIAYETIWAMQSQPSFKKITSFLSSRRPSYYFEMISKDIASQVKDYLTMIGKDSFDILLKGTPEYPNSLNKFEHDLPILYYKGDPSLLESPSVSIVGARNATARGVEVAQRIARGFAKSNYTIVSGLASGIDTAAHTSAIDNGGSTIAVIGTPISECYPKQNRKLQQIIASKHLLISQIPFFQYSKQSWRINRFFFPERNKTMAAISQATIIVEASDTSGTLTQARACIKLGKKLIILKPAYENPNLSWPQKFVKEGAYVAETFNDIKNILS